MINATFAMPFILAILFIASSAYVEFCRPGVFPRLAPRSTGPFHAGIDPVLIAALNAQDFDAQDSDAEHFDANDQSEGVVRKGRRRRPSPRRS